MSKTKITVDLNTLVLASLDKYAAGHGLHRDFVLAVAVDQFLSDPDNQIGATA